MFKAETSLKNLLIVYVLWIAISTFSGSLVYFYFKNAGIGEFDLIVSFFFSVISAILINLALSRTSKFDLRMLMSLGIFAYALSFVLLFLLPPARELLFVYSVIAGLNFFLFWTSFNMMYFELSENRAALLGFIYFSLVALFGIAIPVLSGFIAEDYGFGTLFLTSAILYVLLIFPVYILLRERNYGYDIIDCLGETKGMKTLILVEGVYGGGMLAALAIIPLYYFHTPVEMGMYLSLTTIFSVIASAIVSHLSDKVRRRKLYIRIFGVGLGLASIASSFSITAVNWSIAVSFRNFFSTLFMPFTTAIIADNKQNISKVMIARELLLNSGRVFGIAVVLLCSLLASDIHFSLIFLGASIMLYPLIIELKRKHITVS